MSHVNLSTQQAVLDWWSSGGSVNDAKGPASCIAAAMRFKAAWEMHRDKLADLTTPTAYNKSNRETLARAMRALIYAMDRAQESSGG